jgi:hypothetical protein
MADHMEAKTKLFNQVHMAIRLRHLSMRTEGLRKRCCRMWAHMFPHMRSARCHLPFQAWIPI